LLALAVAVIAVGSVMVELLVAVQPLESVTKVNIKYDEDVNGEYEEESTIEYEYDSGKNPDKGSPELWLNAYGGASWSENNATKAIFTSSSGSVTETETTYEYNEYGYPISETTHGKTTVYEYDCKE